MSKLTQQRGFTIIEVVLVLAIAGLIFLIVFLALPDLERARRNTQRKSDAGHIISALETYASNNNGAYPAGTAAGFNGFMTTYESNLLDPTTGTIYAYTGAAPTKVGQVEYAVQATCTNGALTTGTGNTRQVAIVMALESSGATVATECQANN